MITIGELRDAVVEIEAIAAREPDPTVRQKAVEVLEAISPQTRAAGLARVRAVYNNGQASPSTRILALDHAARIILSEFSL